MLQFNQRMYNEDIDGSIAHVTILSEQGIVTPEEKDIIVRDWRNSLGKSRGREGKC